jgi:hypothetical protein
MAVGIALMLLGGARPRGSVGASLAWLKVTPGALAVGALVDRRTTRPTLIAGSAVFLVSLALSPAAWADLLVVLPNLLRMPANGSFYNLSPANVLSSAGLTTAGVVAAVALPAAFLVLTIANAWQGRLLPWLSAAAGVYLTATATSWDHYFIVLLPIAVAAWPAADRRRRDAMLALLACFGPAYIPLVVAPLRLVALALWLGLLFDLSIRGVSQGRLASQAGTRRGVATIAGSPVSLRASNSVRGATSTTSWPQ